MVPSQKSIIFRRRRRRRRRRKHQFETMHERKKRFAQKWGAPDLGTLLKRKVSILSINIVVLLSKSGPRLRYHPQIIRHEKLCYSTLPVSDFVTSHPGSRM